MISDAPLSALPISASVAPAAGPVFADLAVTLDDVALAAEGTVPLAGALAVTLDDVTLDATGTLSVIGDVAVTLDDVALTAFAVSGTNGPFARRRMLILN